MPFILTIITRPSLICRHSVIQRLRVVYVSLCVLDHSFLHPSVRPLTSPLSLFRSRKRFSIIYRIILGAKAPHYLLNPTNNQ